MATELEKYKVHLENFVTTITGSEILSIDLYIDTGPTFTTSSIPFQFQYCFSVGIQTRTDYYHLLTSMNSDGLESFWLETKNPVLDATTSIKIGLTVLRCDINNGVDNYPYKLTLDFGQKKVWFVCGEIYDTNDPTVFDYKINDEMILFFDHESDVVKFDERVNYR